MNVGLFCTAIVLVVSSIVIQVIYTWFLLDERMEDYFIIPVVIFLFNIIFPIVMIWKSLIMHGLI